MKQNAKSRKVYYRINIIVFFCTNPVVIDIFSKNRERPNRYFFRGIRGGVRRGELFEGFFHAK